MASITSPCYSVISHCVHQQQIISHTRTQTQIPPRILLSIKVGFYSPTPPPPPRFSQNEFFLSLDSMLNLHLLHQLLARTFADLRIDTSSTHYRRLLQQIMDCGLGTPHTYRFKILYLKSEILVERAISRETVITRALAVSALEFERNNYGMVAATESSVKDMIMRVKVEDCEKQNCVVCLEELGVGFEASRMPCSHIFHADCIEIWLKQGHSCPICRYEMPTK